MEWIITGSPVLLIHVIGIIIAIRRYKRHPRVSSLTLLALVGLLLLAVGLPILYRFVPRIQFEFFGSSNLSDMNTYRIISFTQSCLHACLLAVLLWAIFAGRTQQVRVQGADGQFLPADFFKTRVSALGRSTLSYIIQPFPTRK